MSFRLPLGNSAVFNSGPVWKLPVLESTDCFPLYDAFGKSLIYKIFVLAGM